MVNVGKYTIYEFYGYWLIFTWTGSSAICFSYVKSLEAIPQDPTNPKWMRNTTLKKKSESRNTTLQKKTKTTNVSTQIHKPKSKNPSKGFSGLRFTLGFCLAWCWYGSCLHCSYRVASLRGRLNVQGCRVGHTSENQGRHIPAVLPFLVEECYI